MRSLLSALTLRVGSPPKPQSSAAWILLTVVALLALVGDGAAQDKQFSNTIMTEAVIGDVPQGKYELRASVTTIAPTDPSRFTSTNIRACDTCWRAPSQCNGRIGAAKPSAAGPPTTRGPGRITQPKEWLHRIRSMCQCVCLLLNLYPSNQRRPLRDLKDIGYGSCTRNS